jgi:hypothetical protein
MKDLEKKLEGLKLFMISAKASRGTLSKLLQSFSVVALH